MSDVHQQQEAMRVEIKRLNTRLTQYEARLRAVEAGQGRGGELPPEAGAAVAAAPPVAFDPGAVVAAASAAGPAMFRQAMQDAAKLFEQSLLSVFAPLFTSEVVAPPVAGAEIAAKQLEPEPAAAAPADEVLFPGSAVAYTQTDRDVPGPPQQSTAAATTARPAVKKAGR